MTKKQVRERWYEKMYQDDKPLVDYEDYLENEVIRLSEPALSNQSEVKWHKFPEEKPKYSGWVWVTSDRLITNWTYYDELKGWTRFSDEKIIAWAEIIYPKPFTVEGGKV